MNLLSFKRAFLMLFSKELSFQFVNISVLKQYQLIKNPYKSLRLIQFRSILLSPHIINLRKKLILNTRLSIFFLDILGIDMR